LLRTTATAVQPLFMLDGIVRVAAAAAAKTSGNNIGTESEDTAFLPQQQQRRY